MPFLQFSGKFCCALSLSLIYSWAEECSWWPFAKMPQWREPIYLHSDERSPKIMEKAELHYKGKCYLCMRIVIWWFQPNMWVMAAALVCVFVATHVTLLYVKKAYFFRPSYGSVWIQVFFHLLFVFCRSPGSRLYDSCKDSIKRWTYLLTSTM